MLKPFKAEQDEDERTRWVLRLLMTGKEQESLVGGGLTRLLMHRNPGKESHSLYVGDRVGFFE